MAFVVVSVMTALIYMNFNTTLGVFLRDSHGIPEIGYGYLDQHECGHRGALPVLGGAQT